MSINSIKSLKSFLELNILGAFSSGLGLNSFESCLDWEKIAISEFCTKWIFT